MKNFVFFILLCIISYSISAQNIELTFTAINNETFIEHDSVKIINRTQESDTMLFWPDTVLELFPVGVSKILQPPTGFQIYQNYPNPVTSKTMIDICLSKNENVHFRVTDVMGRQVISAARFLEKGCHSFNFSPGNSEIYFFTAQNQNINQSIKILNANQGKNKKCQFHYVGLKSESADMKASSLMNSFSYAFGDELLYVCYADTLESGTVDKPEESQVYTFQFATNIPCPGIPTVEYEGQIYNTIQVCNQCWMKENLNVGLKINPPQMQTDNDIIEKYCMGNESWICDSMGGLYYWRELMNYTYQNGGRGICPEGWHVPTDFEWQILEGTVDSKYGIGSTEWEREDWRGFDGGGVMKDDGSYYWESPNTGATDLFGFKALPGGYFVQGDFWGAGWKGMFWTSDTEKKYLRNMDADQKMIKRQEGSYSIAFSVRCIKNTEDEVTTLPIYLLGNGTTVGWNNMEALPMAWMGDGNFARVEMLTAGVDHYFKFLSDLGQWAPQWGTDNTGTSQGGPLIYRLTEAEPDPEAIPVGDETGNYYIEADTATLEYFTDLTSGELFVLGSATTAGWETGEAIQMFQDTPHVFTIELPLYANGGLKFIEQLGSWDSGWGTDENGTYMQGNIGRWPGLSSDEYSKDLPGPETAGIYLITVDMRTMKYTIAGR